MSLAHKKDEKYTYKDYLTWSDSVRCELINGLVYDMTPAPSRKHQSILGKLHLQFAGYLQNKTCQIYLAPFDVRLPKGNEKDYMVGRVVKPDISTICDK